jgi:mono/diheme cytochrome c family protein
MRGPAILLGCMITMAAMASLVIASGPSAPASDGGRRLYDQHCADCHGVRGRGDGPRAPFLSPRPGNLVSAATAAKSDKELLKIIANGRPRTAMPAWNDRISEEEQREVLRYLRSLVHFHQPGTPPPPDPPSP